MMENNMPGGTDPNFQSNRNIQPNSEPQNIPSVSQNNYALRRRTFYEYNIYFFLFLFFALLSFIVPYYRESETERVLLKKYFNEFKANLTLSEMNDTFNFVFSKSQDGRDEAKTLFANYLQNRMNDIKIEKFMQKTLKDIEGNSPLIYKKEFSKINILLLSRKETQITKKLLRLSSDSPITKNNFRDLSTFRKTSKICSLVNIYDCQNVEFEFPEDGDLKTISQSLKEMEINEDPNDFIHSVIYYTTDEDFIPLETEVIKGLEDLFKGRKINFIVALERTSSEENAKRIFHKIKESLKDHPNIKVIPNFREDEEFYSHLMKAALEGFESIFEDAYFESVNGKIVKKFINFMEDMAYKNKDSKANVNKTMNKIIKYFDLKPKISFETQEISDFYFKTVLNNCFKKKAEEWSQIAFRRIYEKEGLSKDEGKYKRIEDYYNNRIQKDSYLKDTFREFAFDKFITDGMEKSIEVVKNNKWKFREYLNNYLKSKIIIDAQLIRNKVEKCQMDLRRRREGY